MIKIPMDIFAYTNEAAAMAQGGRLVYANGAARELLGPDCEGKSLAAVLGMEIAEAQASNFVADLNLGGRQLSVRATKQETGQFFFFSRPEYQPSILNEAFLYSIKSNLMTMSLAMELCRSKAEEQENREILESMREISRSQFRMSRMASNLSMMMDAMKGQLSCNPKLVDIGWLCQDCVDCVAAMVDGVDFTVNAREGLFIMADPALVKRMLTNLLSNSLVHGKGLSRINVNVLESPESAIISVSDDGCGIGSDELHRVFDRYRHVYDMAEMDEGAGMGLSIVRFIAQSHGGTLLLESRCDSGTTVRVSLKKGKGSALALRSGEEERFDMAMALLELSDCLDSKYYAERYLD